MRGRGGGDASRRASAREEGLPRGRGGRWRPRSHPRRRASLALLRARSGRRADAPAARCVRVRVHLCCVRMRVRAQLRQVRALDPPVCLHGPVVKGFGRGSKTLGIPTGIVRPRLPTRPASTLSPCARRARRSVADP